MHSLYLAASYVSGPLFARLQRKAIQNGKEDPARLPERWGQGAPPRPSGKLVWFHAASVGETQSILPLIAGLLAARDDVAVLVTSTTRTSAQMMQDALSDRVMHQMAPYDTTSATRAFLDHWRPDVAIWIESELWPRMLAEAGRRDIPRLLLNARVSARTARRWARFAKSAHAVLGQFDVIQVQEQATQDAICAIGIHSAEITGALKQDRAPLAYDQAALQALRDAIGPRPVWLAASTHAGEEDIVLQAHRDIGGLLVLVPRHTERADQIAQLCTLAGFSVAVRSQQTAISPQTDVYIADTMGEMGLWYALAPVAFIGGSLMPIGGHNPYEAAQLDAAILHGPHVGSFEQIYAELDGAGGAVCVGGASDLVDFARDNDPQGRAAMTTAASSIVGKGTGATDRAMKAVLAYL